MNPIYYYIGFGLILFAVIIGSGLYARRIYGQLDNINEKLDAASFVTDLLFRDCVAAHAEAKKYKRMAQGADRERLEVLRERDELREAIRREVQEGQV